MTKSNDGPLLIGDSIENPWNRVALGDLAELFGWTAKFCGSKLVQEKSPKSRSLIDDEELSYCAMEEIQDAVKTLLCFDTGSRAQSIYGMKKAKLDQLALVVGNERKGIGRELLHAATKLVQVPMVSRRVNSLNVAAAAAVALYYLSKGSAPVYSRSDPEKHRPDLMILAGDDHIELGSSLRSAAAFGWRQVLLEDPKKIWFDTERARQLESRAAARRSKNKIRIIPSTSTQQHYYDEVVLIRRGPGSPSLARADLARGARQLMILADESTVDLDTLELQRFAKTVKQAHIGFPKEQGYHFRFGATIALAETARQVGQSKKSGKRRKDQLRYKRELETRFPEKGMILSLEELISWDDEPSASIIERLTEPVPSRMGRGLRE